MLKNYFKGGLLTQRFLTMNKNFSTRRGKDEVGKYTVKKVFIFPNVNVDEFDFNEVNTNGNI
jgi:hypothetical protein